MTPRMTVLLPALLFGCAPIPAPEPEPEPAVGSSESTLTSTAEEDGAGTTETSGETGTSIDPTPRFGRFALVAGNSVPDPRACSTGTIDPDAESLEPWFLELPIPEDGNLVARESYGEYTRTYACTLTEDTLACTHLTEVDYSKFAGLDARVRHEASYRATWIDGDLVGTYAPTFACEGSQCGDVRDEWSVAEFPCSIRVQFTGTAVER